MSFLILISSLALLSYLPQWHWGPRNNWRMPLRHGAAFGFLYTGLDHFISLENRYLPMMPDYLSAYGSELIMLSGSLEIAAALALLLPDRWLHIIGLPWLRSAAGVGLTLLLSVMVIANGHVAASQQSVEGLPWGAQYYLWRPFFQPLIILWVLVASEAIWPMQDYPQTTKPLS